MEDELAYVVVGSVDSGKSTLIGTVKSNKLDDGNGSNRNIISNHNHEIKSGKTSSIAVHSLKKYQNNKNVILIDLCGHEKYLKTTMYGIMGYYPDYAIVIISANRGILKMTREHVKILHHLKIPMIMVLTKTDIIDHVYEGSIEDGITKITSDIKKVFLKGNYNLIDMNEIENLNNTDNIYNVLPNNKQIPLFKLSCKTGYGLDIFKRYISNLPKNNIKMINPITNILSDNKKIKMKDNCIFYIESIYCPVGIGWVVTGLLKCDNPDFFIGLNTQLYLGPLSEIITTKVWSIHNYYNEKIDKLYNGQRGCLAIRSDKKILKKFFRKGVVLTNNIEIIKKATYKYKAQIKLLSHPSNVKDNFSPVIHCATVRQSASIKIININNKNNENIQNNENNNKDVKCIYPGDNAIIQLEFKFNPEIIEPNESFFLREGLTLGVGKILEPIY